MSLLEKHPDFSVVGEAGSIREAIERSMELQPDLVLLETDLPDGNGLEAIRGILDKRPDTIIAVLAQYNSRDSFISAIRSGARGYLPKKIPMAQLILSLQALERGEAMIPQTMTSYLVDELQKVANTYPDDRIDIDFLTPREKEVLQLLSTNATNQDIADHLTISKNTVKAHIHNILDKLNLQNRNQAGRFARRQGISSSKKNSLNSH